MLMTFAKSQALILCLQAYHLGYDGLR